MVLHVCTRDFISPQTIKEEAGLARSRKVQRRQLNGAAASTASTTPAAPTAVASAPTAPTAPNAATATVTPAVTSAVAGSLHQGVRAPEATELVSVGAEAEAGAAALCLQPPSRLPNKTPTRCFPRLF